MQTYLLRVHSHFLVSCWDWQPHLPSGVILEMSPFNNLQLKVTSRILSEWTFNCLNEHSTGVKPVFSSTSTMTKVISKMATSIKRSYQFWYDKSPIMLRGHPSKMYEPSAAFISRWRVSRRTRIRVGHRAIGGLCNTEARFKETVGSPRPPRWKNRTKTLYAVRLQLL